ncbi:sugar ABC transporter ATP-binding protein [Ktedonosporobacter rubrisoli]|uniref:Sugar ABC transporter ATP-binding protein n=2 Tax=Ktedonosporobacter rubrisoli TaxID=2509675 RepID=A0A4P6K7H9_KTERU|nr:sugar ABC transporter ATP-binding protein [Ktedonosporobacter rubrisoli]
MLEISKSFPGVRALKGVSLSVKPGEVRALLGENGAGKSTLMNILDGVFSEYDGEIRIAGQPVSIRSPRDAQHQGIAMIHQELNLVPELSISDNIFLGRELRTPWGMLDRQRMHAQTVRLLAELDLTIPPTRPVRMARIAEQQLIEVAKALSLNARILIMDEPTSALADAEVHRLFNVIRQLSARGVAVIYISHRLEELQEIADTVTILRDGELIGTHELSQVSRADLIRMMVGRPLQEFFPKGDSLTKDDEELLRVEHLSLSGDASSGRRPLHDVSFSLQAGEIIGLAGLMGAGRTEVLESIFGVHPHRLLKGHVYLQGRLLDARSPQQAIKRGLAFITEDRKGQSLITQLSVRFNISLSALKKFTRWLFIKQLDERAAVIDYIRTLRIKTPGPTAIVNNLSGGNQQKVVLAKCLLTHPRILLMDEPTRGIDVGAKAEIYEQMNRLAANGLGIIMASSELPELLAMCDRILVLCEGRLTGEFGHGQATQEMILEAATTRESTLSSVG